MKLIKWTWKKLRRIMPYAGTSVVACGVIGIMIYFN